LPDVYGCANWARHMRFVLDARYAGPKPSGIGNYVRAIASRLPHLAPNTDFEFWLPPEAEPLSSSPRVRHRTVRGAPSGLLTLAGPGFMGELSADDIFHAPSNVLGFNLPCSALVTVHDTMWLEHLAWCQPRPWLRPISGAYFGVGIRRAFRHAERVLTVSQASADDIVRLDPSCAARVVVIPNAHEACFRAPEDKAAARALAADTLGFEEPFFLVVGQNQPSKGHPLALEAFAAAALTSYRLVFVQRLEMGRGLQQLARRRGIAERVHFSGSVSLERLVSLYQSASALLQPSLAEGFGLPALEAMACGTPVIAHDIPALREVLGTAGCLVPVGDVAELSSSIKRISREPSWAAELSASGLDRARAFSWDRAAELTWQVYSELLARAPERFGRRVDSVSP
jgi:glycosyltransferase involved in cell wall biosynthesis